MGEKVRWILKMICVRALALTVDLPAYQALARRPLLRNGKRCWLHQMVRLRIQFCQQINISVCFSHTPASSLVYPACAGQLLAGLVKEFLEWCSLEFTKQVRPSGIACLQLPHGIGYKVASQTRHIKRPGVRHASDLFWLIMHHTRIMADL